MSRDAKVGLVIVFSFVFLLGTILLHRFHFGLSDSAAAFNEPVVSEFDSESTLADAGARYPVGDDGIPTSTVDAVPADTISSRTQPDGVRPRDAGFGEGQKSRRTPNLARPPADFPASQSNGEMISLTEAETFPLSTTQHPAAIVESTGPARQVRSGSDGLSGNRAAADNVTNPASPLLEIHTPARKSDQDESIILREDRTARSSFPKSKDAKTKPASSALDRNGRPDGSTAAREMGTDAGGSASESSEQTDISGADELVESRTIGKGRTSDEAISAASDGTYSDTPAARSFPGRSQRAPFDLDDSDRIQQTEGKRPPAREAESPPPLPKYGESPQATIDSVPSRSGRADDRKTSSPADVPSRTVPSKGIGIEEAVDTEDRSNTAQRTYVVKEGDSFWTISAKHYGTGKYFRALEDFNRHRLAAYEDGRRILRPGTEILLPNLALLRSKTAAPKLDNSTTTGTPVAQRDGFKPRQGLEGRPGQNSQDPPPLRSKTNDRQAGSSRVYRVQEGDSLSKIAQHELGSTRRWQEIYELNAEKLEGHDFLRIGLELKLPDDRPVEKLVDRPYDGR